MGQSLDEARARVRQLEAEARELHAAAMRLRDETIASGISAEQLLQARDGDESDPAARAFMEIDAAFRAADGKKVEAEHARDRLQRMAEWGGSAAGVERRPYARGDLGGMRTIGHRLTESEQYQRLAPEGAFRSEAAFEQRMARGFDQPIDLMSRDELMLFLNLPSVGATTVTGGGATSAGPFIQNDLIPGFVSYRRKRPLVSAMVAVSETDSDVVEYVSQSAPTDAAAETAEDSAAPESSYAFTTQTANVREITHFVPVTNRAMADQGQIRGIINNELVAGILDRLDTQLVSGDGAGQNLTGIYNTSGIGTVALGGYNRSEALHKAITAIRVAAGVLGEPDNICLHPNDYDSLILEQDVNGNYIFGPPSQAESRTCWGVPLRTSPVFTSGTPLVGDFLGSATLWIREALTVNTGLNSDDFARRRVSMLAAIRVAFAVGRPGGFCTVTGF